MGAVIAYGASLIVAQFTGQPKKTMVLRDDKGRLEGIIET